MWVGIGLSVLQQFTGINVIFYYSTTLWQAVGFTEQDSLTITVITSVTNIVTTIVAIMLIDKVGRKPLLLVGAIGQFLCLAVLTLMFATATVVDGEPVLEGAAGTTALVAANLYVVFFGAIVGPGGMGAARRDVQQQASARSRCRSPQPRSGRRTSSSRRRSPRWPRSAWGSPTACTRSSRSWRSSS